MTGPLGPSYRDLLATPAAVAWRQLRTIRSSPPGAAQNGDRRAVFGAALEQAEQFFSAAGSVGPATKPVLLFYGLSQATRSIAAASVSTEEEAWRLPGGHGIKARAMQGVVNFGLASLTLQDRGRGGFTVLAEILNAASLPSETRLGDLWCLLPDMRMAPLPGMGEGTPLELQRLEPPTNVRFYVPSPRTTVIVSPLPRRIADTGLPNGIAISDLGGPIEEQRQAATAYLNRYPSLRGWSFYQSDPNPIGAMITSDDTCQVAIMLGESRNEQEQIADVATKTFNYQGTAFAFPSVGDSELSTHPLLLWYAILYGLSMLSRYQPKEWSRLINIDLSEDASPIEGALDEAMRSLPQLILETLHVVAR
ncbi:MAG: YaaC family protein [Isosphaeraceae bacterium]